MKEVDSELQRRLFPSDAPPGEYLAPADVSGSQLDHFRIEEMIGRGGMGAVFRAFDERLDRIVALKVLSPTYCRDPSTVERFRNEARAAARLDHENVARVFYTGEDRGMNFIAFEFVTGTNLRELIRENGRLAPEEAVNYTLQVAAALRHTSAAGVVHRDIKPSNIIITPSGRAKLVDLGLARKETTESAPELTVAGTTLGTFDYISPEQARDPRDVDVRSDIYSLGCTLYHMLTGEPPYPEGTFLQRLLDRKDKSPPDPALKAPHISASLSAVIQKMMAGTPRLRHSTADELINDLMLIAGELGLRGVHPEGLVWAHASRLHRTRFLERNLGWIVTAAILAIVVFAVDRFSRNTGEARTRFAGNGLGETNSDVRTDRNAGPGRDASGANRKTAGRSSDQTAPTQSDGVNQPSQITLNQHLDPRFVQALEAGTGVFGAAAIETSSESQGVGVAASGPPKTPSGTSGDGSKPAGNSSRPGTGVVSGDGPEKPFAISIAGRSETYRNLESACAAATSGQVIVLSFDGIRKDVDGQPVIERPVKVDNKSITIRAADGRHPVLLFAGEDVAGRSAQTRMVTVANGGALNVIGVGVQMKVTDQVDAENDARWSVFALQGSDSVRLTHANVTIENPGKKAAAFFEIVANTGSDLARMKMMKNPPTMVSNRFEITVAGDSFLRGHADVLAIAHSRPGLLSLERTAVITGQSLVAVAANGSGEMVAEKDPLDLKLRHVTCITGAAPIRIDAGEMPGSVLPVRVWSQDSLFSVFGKQPFVSITGTGQIRDMRRLLAWKGEKNFYRGYSSMWRIAPDGGATKPDEKSFDDWRTFWGEREVDASETGVVWKRPDWSSTPAGSVVPADLELDSPTSTSGGPSAINGATDGTAAGADIPAIQRRMGLKPKTAPVP